MTEAEWVQKLNAIAREVDAIFASVHPSVAATLTAELVRKYRALAQSNNVMPDAK